MHYPYRAPSIGQTASSTDSRYCWRWCIATCLVAIGGWAHAYPARLSEGGRALLPVVVAVDASPRIRQAASDLALYLGRISGADFKVSAGDGRAGIVVGLPQQFRQVVKHGFANVEEGHGREDYLIQSTKRGLLILGATDQGVEHGVWDLLYRLGYRQFFPGPHWEVGPHSPDLKIDVEVRASPSYYSRRIWYGYGPWDYAIQPYQQWTLRNRLGSGFQLNTGHAYGRIIRALKPEFDRHPEFYALVKGERKASPQAKLCIGNEELRKLVVAFEIGEFRKHPALDSVSLDPSDGGGWCECEKCQALGSVSDRVVLLANEVATAIDREFPGKKVGIYAYAFHSPPPSLRVHKNIVVSVATAFLEGDFSVDQLMEGWRHKGASLGVREYYSVNPWDRDQAGQSRGSNIDYLRKTIPQFHAQGARFLSAESSDNWGPNGLGYYVASRLMWDVREANNIDGIVDDFLARAFGSAKAPMKEFYRQLDGARPNLVVEDQIARMFRLLATARELAKDEPAVQSRLSDLVLYAHYNALYRKYSMAHGQARQAAFESLIRHAYRMRTSMMVHTKALYRDLVGRDKTVHIPNHAKWNVPEARNPWKTSDPYSEGEIAELVASGITQHALANQSVQSKSFGDDLLPANFTSALERDRGGFGGGLGSQTFFIHIKNAPSDLDIMMSGDGSIEAYQAREISLALSRVGGASDTGEKYTLVGEQGIKFHDGSAVGRIHVTRTGVYRLAISDIGLRVRVSLPTDIPVVVASTHVDPMNPSYQSWMGYFFVPKGTVKIAFRGGEHGEIQDSQNRTVFWLNGRPSGVYQFDVPDSEDGKVWRVRFMRSGLQLLTAPSYFSPHPDQLMVPSELIE